MFKKLTYGIGNLSYSVINQTMTSFFVFFATSILDLSGICVGIAIAISTIWDGISDTFVGFLSDNHNFLKMGKRNGFMLVASIGMAIFNLLIWCVPSNISNFFKFIWIIISLILAIISKCKYNDRLSLIMKNSFYWSATWQFSEAVPWYSDNLFLSHNPIFFKQNLVIY